MAKVFGLKEARAASEFAKTKEQRLTVLAVVKMLGLPILVHGEAKARVSKLDVSFKNTTTKAGKLKKKIKKLEANAAFDVLQKYDALEVSKDWSVGR